MTQPSEEPVEEPVEVPHTEISAEALIGLIDSYVLREGTDYGAREFSLEEKRRHVLAQLERGDARITFDPTTHSVNIVMVRAGR